MKSTTLVLSLLAIVNINLISGCASGPGLTWKLKKDDATIYIFATYHGGSSKYMKLPSTVKKILNNVDAVGFESISYGNQRTQVHIEKISNEEISLMNQMLAERVLTTEDTEAVKQTTSDAITKVIQPILINKYYSKSEIDNFDAKDSSEAEILDAAIKTKKTIFGLETPGAVWKVWRLKCGDELRTENIKSVHEQIKSKNVLLHFQELQSLVWYGDIAKFSAKVEQDRLSYPHINNEFLCSIGPRNKAWIKEIEALQQHKRILLIVGAGHVVGDYGLIKLLSNEGYEIEQLH